MKARAYRLIGPAEAHARGRIALPIDDGAEARCVVLGPSELGLAAVARALPDPSTLAPRTLVVVPGTRFDAPSLSSRLLSAFKRAPAVPRSDRCGALLARGYVDIGASAEPDLAWGYVTGPC